jgi:tetratricopeptide (TPR) repeat protein
LREVAAGRPVLVLQDLGLGPFRQWHYAVVIGYDYARGDVYLRSGENRRQVMPFTVFELTWRRSGYWAIVVTTPGVMPASATQTSYLPAVLAFDRNATPDAARTAWQAFLARWPGDALASLALGNRLYAERDLAGAESVLRAALRTHSTSTEMLNNLAQVLAEQGRNDEALVVIERATTLPGPFAAEIAATRAGILQRMTR